MFFLFFSYIYTIEEKKGALINVASRNTIN